MRNLPLLSRRKDLSSKGIPISMIIAALLLTAGCGSLLPTARQTIESPWESFDEAKAAFDQIVPYETSAAELTSLGFDPFLIPNVKILTYIDIIQRFLPNQSFRKEDLPEGIQDCIEAMVNCHAYEMAPQAITSKRFGGFWADLLRFRRRTQETGWRFEALVVLVDNTVVYKLWGGTPIFDEYRETKNPLGPLQDPTDLVIEGGKSAF